MAKVKPLIGPMSGKVGGNVFGHNRGGLYVRQHSVPVNKNSDRQQTVREALAHASARWQALTDLQRSEWLAYAEANPIMDTLGLSIKLTGQQMFVSCNARLASMQSAPITTAPTVMLTTTLGTTAIALTAPGTCVVSWDGGTLPAGQKLELLLSPPGTAGRDPNARTGRHAASSAAAQSSPCTMASVIGFQTGQTVNAWVRVVDQYGQATVLDKIRSVAG
jgi:hypothetical protein